jgi:DNA-binding NarL/FixJ family response regulator
VGGPLSGTTGRLFELPISADRRYTLGRVGHGAAISVVLVDDHAALREGLATLLERRGFEVVDSAGTAADAATLLARSEPEVAVVDLALPDEDGAELVRRLRVEHPELKLVVYTGIEDGRALADALHAGAHGYVSKVAGLEALTEAIREVTHGRRYRDAAIEALLRRGDERETTLTPREREVVALLADGLSGEEAAERLVLSPETVRTHIRNAMAKLEAHTRAGAVAEALRRGEIDL